MACLEDAQAFQAPERVQLGQGLGPIFQDHFERLCEGGAAPLNDEALGGVPPPAVRVAEEFYEILGGEGLEFGSFPAGLVLVTNAIDAAVSVARSLQFAAEDLLAQIAGDVGLVLNDAVIHVENVEAAIRGGVGVDWPEALVGGGEEFLFTIRVIAGERAVAVPDADRLDKIPAWFSDESRSVGLGRKIVAAINGQSGSAGGIDELVGLGIDGVAEIGRASCRERV